MYYGQEPAVRGYVWMGFIGHNICFGKKACVEEIVTGSGHREGFHRESIYNKLAKEKACVDFQPPLGTGVPKTV
jgi:hypothetical protein